MDKTQADTPEMTVRPTESSTAQSGSSTKPTGQKQKRPNPGNKKFNQANKRPKQAPEFLKTKPSTAITSVRALDVVFELATSFLGIRIIAHDFYDILQARDSKMTNLFTVTEFTYVILLSVYYRCALIANEHKTAIIYGLSELKTLAEHLLLPDAIATFVETFGTVELTNTAKVCPYFRAYNHMRNEVGFDDPLHLLHQINRERVERDEEPYELPNNHWGLDERVIIKYSRAVSRALKNAIELRPVNNQELVGRPEFLSVFEVDGNHIKCHAIDRIDSSQCQLGACYRLRNREMMQGVGIQLPVMFGTDTVRPDVYLNSVFMKALRGQ